MEAASDTVAVEVYREGIWRYLRFLGCDPSLADDLTQETFAAVLASSFTAYSPAATQAYLRTTARNLFLKQLRRATPQELNEADAVWTRYEKEDAGSSYLAALRNCFEKLDVRSKEVLVLKFQEQLAPDAIARRASLSLEGLKTLIRRAKERLKRCIEGKLVHE